MKNLPLLIGTVFGTLILILGVAVFFSQGSSSSSQITADATTVLGTEPHTKGTENAPVTIVEFSDFQCLACRAAQPLVEKVIADNPGKVAVVYRHFPLDSIHRNARMAAQAAEVAAEYGKFWEYHDLLFQYQNDWEGIADRAALKGYFADYAEQLEIDKTEFASKIESQQVVDAVQADSAAALQLGITATPTFFVNGVQTSAPELQQAVESVVSSMPAE